MVTITYLDFDLSIEPIAEFRLPFAALAVEDLCPQFMFLLSWR